MLRWILALLLIPFLDAVLLAVVVSQTDVIGWVGMVLLVVLTGLVGMLLVRAEGRRTIRKIQRSLAQGTPPTDELVDGALLIAAGAFLLTPGLVTDLIGFLLVIPLTRIPIRMALKRYVIVPYADEKTGGFASGQVWTFGFPDEGGPQSAGGSGFGPFGGGSNSGGGGASSAGGTGGSGQRTGPGTGTDGDTVDLGSDEYTVAEDRADDPAGSNRDGDREAEDDPDAR